MSIVRIRPRSEVVSYVFLFLVIICAAAFLPILSYAISSTISSTNAEALLSVSHLSSSAQASVLTQNRHFLSSRLRSRTFSLTSNKPLRHRKFNQRNKRNDRRDSFVSRASRHNRANAKAAHRRVGSRYSKYLHSRDTKIDFGCGAVRCTCPLSENASFAQLRVEAYRLRTEQRLQESAACMSQAMDNYLARAGRYYVPLGADGAAKDLSSAPVDVPSTGPVPLAALAHSDAETRAAAMEAAAQRGLSPEEAKRAHQAAQAIVDKLNRGPDEDWMVRRRRVAPQLARANELASQSDVVPQAYEDHPSQLMLPDEHTAHQHHWEPETDSSRAHAIAHEYQEQLRKQWLSWGNSQQKADAKSKRKL